MWLSSFKSHSARLLEQVAMLYKGLTVNYSFLKQYKVPFYGFNHLK